MRRGGRATDLLLALVEGREAVIERTLRVEAATLDQVPDHDRAERPARPPAPEPLPPAPPRAERAVRSHLADRRSLRRAILLQEVLGPPRSLRPPG